MSTKNLANKKYGKSSRYVKYLILCKLCIRCTNGRIYKYNICKGCLDELKK